MQTHLGCYSVSISHRRWRCCRQNHSHHLESSVQSKYSPSNGNKAVFPVRECVIRRMSTVGSVLYFSKTKLTLNKQFDSSHPTSQGQQQQNCLLSIKAIFFSLLANFLEFSLNVHIFECSNDTRQAANAANTQNQAVFWCCCCFKWDCVCLAFCHWLTIAFQIVFIFKHICLSNLKRTTWLPVELA